MINNLPIDLARTLLNLIGQSRLPGSSPAGAVLKATVIEISDTGEALLRFLSAGTAKSTPQDAVIKVRSEAPLAKGQTVYLEVLGGKENLELKLIRTPSNPVTSHDKKNPPQLIDLLTHLSGSKLTRPELKLMLQILKSLPVNTKKAFPELLTLENLVQNPGKPDSQHQIATIARHVLTVKAAPENNVPSRAGTVVKAEVIQINNKGDAQLRLISSDSISKTVQGMTITVRMSAPVIKGQQIYLEVLESNTKAGKAPDRPGEPVRAETGVQPTPGKPLPPEYGGKNSEIVMRLVSGFRKVPEASPQVMPVKLLNMFAQLSEAKLNSSEFKFILSLLRSLPQSVKTAIPEFRNLEKLIPDITQLDGKVLKAFVESSGVALETRMKIAITNTSGSLLQNLTALRAEGDIKLLLLSLQKLLKDRDVVNTLKRSGYKMKELTERIEGFIRNIEFFQFSSKINDIFYTFLPALWEDLRDGELLFRKDRNKRKTSYSCGINLDLERMGRLSISVTVSNREFYVTFHSERADVAHLIESQKHLLQNGFASQGLSLKAVNIDQKNTIVFGESQLPGVSVKI